MGKKQKKDIVKNVDAWGKADIESIQGSKHFDAAISGEIAIQHFIKEKENEKNKQERITFDGKQYNKCEEITKYSNDELLVSFYNTVKYLFTNDNLFLHLNCIPSYPFSSLPRETNPNPRRCSCYPQVARGQ